ncbi:hypothetical protein P389DRAFT_166483 [Cystobasidium minutum MCA 4210]|uniref:uncharacterized protein n=1 Tax=Cystobasidium minutum MCA 4210 TaxID=1397322 RepID=UPI0034CED89C|eukprot:jgi/Rhomi1/166483/fgenesh1_kg.2_\
MAVPGHSRTQRTPGQTGNARRTAPPPAPRPPVSRLGGGIRVVRSANPPSDSTASTQEHNGGYHSSTSVPLFKRLLYPGVSDKAPRIFHSPGTERVDEQLYNLLALICRGFISPWYSKISRDRAFLLEIVRVASHVFRQLEARLVEGDEVDDIGNAASHPPKIDKIGLLFSTLPRILERHIADYHTAEARSKSAYSAGIQNVNGLSNLEVYFHYLQPHAAVSLTSPDQGSDFERLPATIDADYVRTAIDALLEQLLPKEDFAAETERSVVREVIVGIILEGVFRKVAQPWFIHGLIVKLLEPRTPSESAHKSEDIHEHSANCAATSTHTSYHPQVWWLKVASFVANLPILFSRLVALFGYLSFLFTTSFASSHYKRYSSREGHLTNITQDWSSLALSALQAQNEERQTLWQVGRTAQTIATITSPVTDRIIVHYLYTRIFTAAFTARLLQTVEETLFPGGYPAPAVPDPDIHEQTLLKQRAVNALAEIMPAETTRLLLRTEDSLDSRTTLAAELLKSFSSHYANIHLYLFILDTLVAKFCPELVTSA